MSAIFNLASSSLFCEKFVLTGLYLAYSKINEGSSVSFNIYLEDYETSLPGSVASRICSA